MNGTGGCFDGLMISTRVCEVTVPRAGGGISVFYCAAEITGGCTFLKTVWFFAVEV